MIYNDVDIYDCKFFTINKNGKIEFLKGEFRGKTPDDFNTIHELQRGVTYCFWILNKEENSLSSKYMASAFIKEMIPKLNELEVRIRERAVKYQEMLKKKTEGATKTIGTRYGEVH